MSSFLMTFNKGGDEIFEVSGIRPKRKTGLEGRKSKTGRAIRED